MKDEPKVSIIIRAFNEEKYIGRLFEEICRQKTDLKFEIVLVDSGSTDQTLKIASQYPVKVIPIKPENFTFGYSLNKGIENACGEICVIVSAHCYPRDQYWLTNLVEPFSDNNVALVYGRQIGNDVTKYSEHQIFAKWFPYYNIDNCRLPFCNNANSAIRRSLWQKRRFNEKVKGLEDLDCAKYLMSQNYRISYRADACVYHIHEEEYRQIFKRYYREALAYREIYPNEKFSLGNFVKFFMLNTFSDYSHAIRDRKLLKNFLGIPVFRGLQFWATYRAHHFRVKMSKAMQWQLYYPRKFLGRSQESRYLENLKIEVRRN